MATLRLFASVRVAAGTGRAEFDADTVGGVVAAAVAAYGPDFADQVQQCRVWLDGEPAEHTDPVTVHSEVALLPPVSGGCGATGIPRLAADRNRGSSALP